MASWKASNMIAKQGKDTDILLGESQVELLNFKLSTNKIFSFITIFA